MARQLVELGFRGSGEVLKREEFEARKAAAEASRLSERTQQKTLSSAGKELKDNFLKALAEREEANRSGKMAWVIDPSPMLLFTMWSAFSVPTAWFSKSIIFIRDQNSRGQEVSAYIDYAHRLKVDEFEIYFNGKKKLFPRRTDLSFYNWDRNVSTSNASPNYQVIAENACGLLFKNKCDRKIVNVDPKAYPGDSTTRTPIETNLYLQVVIYDHILRRKT
nr:cilia- and flagella-associated protein 299 isoform X3 [Chelonoidis abingdonii]